MPLLRKIVFYVFALIYLILCPLLVARMLGYVVNPLTHHWVKTGLIYISTNPPQATVYVDGKEVPQKTPVVIRDLTPGRHFVRVEMAGYNDWERYIPVARKKATVLDNTLLIPLAWPIARISTIPYEDLVSADDNLLLATSTFLKNIGIYHTTQGIEADFNQDATYEKTPLFTSHSIYAGGRLVHLYNSFKSPYVLVEAELDGKRKFLWANVHEKPPVVEDISALMPQDPSRIAWNNQDNDTLYAFYGGSISRIHIQEKTAVPINAGSLPKNLGNQPDNPFQQQLIVNANNDLLIRQGRWIKIYPQEDFGGPESYGIAESLPGTNMYFEEKNGKLFYLDSEGFLSVAQILPYRPIIDIPVPDSLRSTL